MKYLGFYSDCKDLMIEGKYYFLYNYNYMIDCRKYTASGKYANDCAVLHIQSISYDSFKLNNYDNIKPSFKGELVLSDEVFELSENEVKMLLLESI